MLISRSSSFEEAAAVARCSKKTILRLLSPVGGMPARAPNLKPMRCVVSSPSPEVSICLARCPGKSGWYRGQGSTGIQMQVGCSFDSHLGPAGAAAPANRPPELIHDSFSQGSMYNREPCLLLSCRNTITLICDRKLREPPRGASLGRQGLTRREAVSARVAPSRKTEAFLSQRRGTAEGSAGTTRQSTRSAKGRLERLPLDPHQRPMAGRLSLEERPGIGRQGARLPLRD
jgi:hypothetical protein